MGSGDPNYLLLQQAVLSKPETVHMGGLMKARTKLRFRSTIENIQSDQCSFFPHSTSETAYSSQ